MCQVEEDYQPKLERTQAHRCVPSCDGATVCCQKDLRLPHEEHGIVGKQSTRARLKQMCVGWGGGCL